MPLRVLLVCSGNTCRSAMGEGILRKLVASVPRANVEVSSAGTLGIEGAPATDEAIEVARRHGVDIGGHLSRAVTPDRVERADLILGMTALHVDELRRRFPAAVDRVHLLSVFADGSDVDVPDPIGGPTEEYERAYEMIEALLGSALPRIAGSTGPAASAADGD